MITELTISQNNIEGVVNVMAVHNDLVFLIDAEYTGDIPNYIYCSILIDGTEVLLARCLYNKDISDGVRQFIFVADEILRGYMPSFEDFVQESGTFVEVSNMTKQFTLNFQDDLVGTVTESIEIEACHAARDIGQSANMDDFCLNNNEIYYGAVGLPVYVYFYNAEYEAPTNTAYFIESTGNYFTINGQKTYGTNGRY